MSAAVITWDDFVAGVRSRVAGRPIDVWSEGNMVSLSAGAVAADGEVEPVHVGLQDFGDGMVRITTGWYTTVSADYTSNSGETSRALALLDGILDGNVEESAYLDDAGALVGISARVWHAFGDSASSQGRTGGRWHHRRLPRWP